MVRLLAVTCGWLTGPAETFLAGQPGRLRVPVPCFLIDHPQGLVLFDSGLHADLAHGSDRLGMLAKFFDVHFGASESVAARLTAAGVDPGRVRYLVNSHLHFDHTGGNASIPNAELVVQRVEWEAGRDADLRARNAYNPLDYDLGHRLRLVEGEHDLFGDGRVVCLSRPTATRRGTSRFVYGPTAEAR
jgi:N-acyl homoserine lactone hydrolase